MSVIAGVPNFVGNSPGVSAVNSITGAVSVTSPDASVTISTSGQELQLEAAGGGSPGTPPLSLQAASADGTTFIGVPNSSVDPSTGDVTLGAGLTVNSIDGVFLNDDSSNSISIAENNAGSGVSVSAFGVNGGALNISADGSVSISTNFLIGGDSTISLDSTGGNGGTGPINLTSAGGMTFTNTGASQVTFLVDGSIQFFSGEAGNGDIFLVTNDVGGNGVINLITGSGSINATSAGTMTFDDTALSGGGSKLDLDATTPGVATLTTIFNAVGGYQANGVAGISGSGSTMTNVTVVNGIITAATFT